MHLLLDAMCTRGLDDEKMIHAFITSVARSLGLHIQHLHTQGFSNGSFYGPGVSGVALIAESHICVHTAPERTLLQLCIHSCKEFDHAAVLTLVHRYFGIPHIEFLQVIPR